MIDLVFEKPLFSDQFFFHIDHFLDDLGSDNPLEGLDHANPVIGIEWCLLFTV